MPPLTPGDVDWRAFTGLPEHAVSCRCGDDYTSHAIRIRDHDGDWRVLSREPCPGCKRFDNAWRVGQHGNPSEVTA